MRPGYCVIGLQQVSTECFRSVRPMPTLGFAWPEPFAFRRGDHVGLLWIGIRTERPHVEDVQSLGMTATGKPGKPLGDEALIECLRKAEFSPDLEHLFGCPARASQRGGGALWVNPAEAGRSIFGCEYENLRFRLFPEPNDFKLRAEMTL